MVEFRVELSHVVLHPACSRLLSVLGIGLGPLRILHLPLLSLDILPRPRRVPLDVRLLAINLQLSLDARSFDVVQLPLLRLLHLVRRECLPVECPSLDVVLRPDPHRFPHPLVRKVVRPTQLVRLMHLDTPTIPAPIPRRTLRQQPLAQRRDLSLDFLLAHPIVLQPNLELEALDLDPSLPIMLQDARVRRTATLSLGEPSGLLERVVVSHSRQVASDVTVRTGSSRGTESYSVVWGRALSVYVLEEGGHLPTHNSCWRDGGWMEEALLLAGGWDDARDCADGASW